MPRQCKLACEVRDRRICPDDDEEAAEAAPLEAVAAHSTCFCKKEGQGCGTAGVLVCFACMLPALLRPSVSTV